MTDQEFFEALDLTIPGMALAEELFRAGRIEEAQEAIVRHFAAREMPEVLEVPGADSQPSEEIVAQADEAYRGEFRFYTETVRYPEARIDWDWVPIQAPGRDQNGLVCVLNSLYSTAVLGMAYLHTREEKYARTSMDLMLDWIGYRQPLPAQPPPSPSPAIHPIWTPSDVSHRVEYMAQAYFAVRNVPSISPDEFFTVLKCLLHHCRFAHRWHGYSNSLIGELERQIRFGLVFPEFRDSRSWREDGIRILDLLLDDYHYPDGAYMELCYFRQRYFLTAAELCQRYGIEIPEGYLEKLEKTFDLPVFMSKPSGHYPTVNDGGHPMAYPPEAENTLAGLGAEFFGREDYRYLATLGKEGKEPEFRSIFFPYAGYIVMRSDWSKQARYLLFDAGRNRGNHNHLDKLSIELSAFGANLIVDTGYGGPFRSAWRKEYYIHTAGHNTILVDGRSQVWGAVDHSEKGTRMIGKEPVPCQWITGRNFDFAAATYDYGYGRQRPGHEKTGDVEDCVNLSENLPYLNEMRDVYYPGASADYTDRYFLDILEAEHRRKVFFARPNYWFVTDLVTGQGVHRVESLLHFPPEAEVEVSDDLVRVKAGDVGLLVVPVNPDGFSVEIVRGREEPLQGWAPGTKHFGDHIPTPTAVFSLERELPAALGFLLMPFRGKEPEVRVSYLPAERANRTLSASQALGATIELEGNTTHFLSLAQPGQITGFGDLEWDGDFAQVERDSSGQPTRLCLIGGSYLRRAGETWVKAAQPFDWLELEYGEDQILAAGSPETLPEICAPRGQKIVMASD